MGRGQFHVVQTAHILHMYDLEDVVDTGHNLDIGFVGVHEMTTVGEVHQFVAASILRQIRVVLVGKVTPEGVHGNIFAPLQFLDEGDAVEELAVQVP